MSKRIKERRKHLGLKLDFVADRAGISKGYLSQIENGHRGNRLTYVLARKLANVLETTPDELLEEEAE
ncbi:helix-turn-helix transcriptional regulator [Brevibacillus sp. AG]|uniref:helix-turn-helix domain-containing protein n=1 Tax=Brevibacillus sp. AG TaxID=3020891 RepID=UPI002330303E|nr:helix-turn-helix transcriptional regulator [Brevibacillus sp. AG]MDC0763465.1 helix-turn-helix transcriptional regulator [Brevibacillus sp. AG]